LVITAFNRPGWSAGARTCALVRTRSTDRSICTTTDPRVRRPTAAMRGRRRAQRGGNPTAGTSPLLGAPLDCLVGRRPSPHDALSFPLPGCVCITTDLVPPFCPYHPIRSGHASATAAVAEAHELVKARSASRRPRRLSGPERSVRWRRRWRSADACVGTRTTELVKAREHIRVSQRVAWPTTPLNGPRRRGRPRARALVRARSTDRSVPTTALTGLRRPTRRLSAAGQQRRGATLLNGPLHGLVRRLT